MLLVRPSVCRNVENRGIMTCDWVTEWPVTEWPSYRVTKWWSDQVTKWLSDQVTKWLSDRMTKQPSDRVTKWPSDQVKEWPSDQVTEWQKASQTIDRMVYFLSTLFLCLSSTSTACNVLTLLTDEERSMHIIECHFTLVNWYFCRYLSGWHFDLI